jgi:hypothetical protein
MNSFEIGWGLKAGVRYTSNSKINSEFEARE